jgi:predicted GTPase
VSNGKAMLTLADLYDALRSSMREKNLKMSPQQGIGKELQPHLYTFCKNKAFDPILEQIQELEQEIDQTAEQIKRGAVKSSEVYLRKLKAEVEQGGISSMDVGHRLLSRIEDLLAFCEWYLKYEKTFLNEIFQHTIKPRLEAKETELSNLRQNFKLKEIELSEKYQNVLNDVKKHKAFHETEISQLNKKLKDSIQKQSKLEASLIAKQKYISTLMREKSQESSLASKSSYNENIKHLSLLTSRVLEGQKRLDMTSDAGDTEKLVCLISNETFKVLVVGEFNVGKSTFINALIGEEALPTKAIPATAIINILKYGEAKMARLHFKDKEKKPLNIPVEKLSNYVLIKNSIGENDVLAEIRDAPFSHAEIWLPLDLLKNNKVEIIDSPGLNEKKVREDITMDYLNKVDAVLFLMAAVRFGPAPTEIDSINLFHTAEHHDLFFIVNQWDMLRPSQQEEVKSNALSILPALTKRKNGIYFVSALDALEGRTENNTMMEQRSGFEDFETDFYQFLYKEKGTVKMLRSARELRKIIQKALTKSIPERVAMIKKPLEELEKRRIKLLNHPNELNKELLLETQASIPFARKDFDSELTKINEFSEMLSKTADELDEFYEAVITNKPK